MSTKILQAVMCAALGLAFAAVEARGEFITEVVTLNVRDPDGQGGFPAPVDPLLDIRRVDASGGSVFTNQTSGAPFSLGGEVRTLAASLLGTAIDSEAFTPLKDNRAATLGNDLVQVLAGFATITTGGAIAEATFTAGRVYIISVAPGSFDPRNPSTWGWALGAGVLAEFDLVTPPLSVSPGAGESLAFDSSVMNTSSANTTSSNQGEGRFLVQEDSTAAQNAIAKGGDDWITVTSNTSGKIQEYEGFVLQTFQTIEFADINAVGVATAGGPVLSGSSLDAVDLGIMNLIYNDMRVKEGLVADYGWATGFGGAAPTDWNPRWPGPAGDGPTGDFRAQLQTRMAFGASAVPEPGSLVVFGTVFGVASLFGIRRRRKAS